MYSVIQLLLLGQCVSCKGYTVRERFVLLPLRNSSKQNKNKYLQCNVLWWGAKYICSGKATENKWLLEEERAKGVESPYQIEQAVGRRLQVNGKVGNIQGKQYLQVLDVHGKALVQLDRSRRVKWRSGKKWGLKISQEWKKFELYLEFHYNPSMRWSDCTCPPVSS